MISSCTCSAWLYPEAQLFPAPPPWLLTKKFSMLYKFLCAMNKKGSVLSRRVCVYSMGKQGTCDVRNISRKGVRPCTPYSAENSQGTRADPSGETRSMGKPWYLNSEF